MSIETEAVQVAAVAAPWWRLHRRSGRDRAQRVRARDGGTHRAVLRMVRMSGPAEEKWGSAAHRSSAGDLARRGSSRRVEARSGGRPTPGRGSRPAARRAAGAGSGSGRPWPTQSRVSTGVRVRHPGLLKRTSGPPGTRAMPSECPGRTLLAAIPTPRRAAGTSHPKRCMAGPGARAG